MEKPKGNFVSGTLSDARLDEALDLAWGCNRAPDPGPVVSLTEVLSRLNWLEKRVIELEKETYRLKTRLS